MFTNKKLRKRIEELKEFIEVQDKYISALHKRLNEK